ncbi:2-methylcitrate dehydratase [Hortaea werneckii]|nr:2-methylcitrate dehydratase [Hortaea werneckii]
MARNVACPSTLKALDEIAELGAKYKEGGRVRNKVAQIILHPQHIRRQAKIVARSEAREASSTLAGAHCQLMYHINRYEAVELTRPPAPIKHPSYTDVAKSYLRFLLSNVHVHILLDQPVDDLLREVRLDVLLVLLHDLRLGFFTAETVAEWGLDHFLLQHCAVLQTNGQRVGDGALVRVVVVLGELRVFDTFDALTEALDKWARGGFTSVAVVRSHETVEDEHDSGHVLHAVISVGVVVHSLELLVDDADAGFVSAVCDLFDVLGRLAHRGQLLVQTLSRLDGGLRVEFRGVGDLEEDVLHDIALVRALELELAGLEGNVVESPSWSGEDSGDASLAVHHLQGEVDSLLASITSSPRLTGHGVRCVTVSTERLAVSPGLRDGVAALTLGKAQHRADNCRGGDLDQDDVVQADLVEGVLQCHHTLNLVGLDHSLQDVTDSEDLAASQLRSASLVGAVDPVGHGEDGTHVVTRVTPFGGEPAVVEVQPANHGADVEGAVDGVQDELGAGVEIEGTETTAERVEEDEAGGVDLEGHSHAPNHCRPCSCRHTWPCPQSPGRTLEAPSEPQRRRTVGGWGGGSRGKSLSLRVVGNSGAQAEWSLGAALAEGVGGGGASSRKRPASEGGHAHDSPPRSSPVAPLMLRRPESALPWHTGDVGVFVP